MGEKLTGNNNGLAEPPKRSVNAGNPAGGSAAGNPRTTAAGNPRTPTAGGSAGGSVGGSVGGKTEEKQVISKLVNVTETPPIPETPKKKQTRKPRKKKEEPQNFNSAQISALLVAMSGIVASRPHCEMFALSEMEAQQIGDPLANIIAKSEKLAGMSEHTDAIALVTACFVIMIPRFIMYFDAEKKRKETANGGLKIGRNQPAENKKSESARSDRKPVNNPTPADKTNVNSVLAAIPAIF